MFQNKSRANQRLPFCLLMVRSNGRLGAESLRGEVRRWRALPLHGRVGGRRRWQRRGGGSQLLGGRCGMLHCPLSSVFSDSVDLLRVSRSWVGGGKGGGGAGEGGSLMGVDLWERLLRRERLAPGPGLGLGAGVGVGRGRRLLPALGIGSGQGRSLRELLQRSHVGLFSRSVQEPAGATMGSF